MNRLPLLPLLFLLLVIHTTAFAQEDGEPALTPTDCFVTVPDDLTADCGTVTVTEDREAGTGTVDLAVMRFPAENDADADTEETPPLFLLAGGPGASGIETFVVNNADTHIKPFVGQRDVVVYDQRGTRYSDMLTCAGESEQGMTPRFDRALPPVEFAQFFADFVADCGENLSERGENPAAYTSVDSAADIHDVAAALGYDPIDLYGRSYGTRLALETLREHPDLIRAAVLDAVYPPQANGDEERLPLFADVLDRLFAACESDDACAEAYPGLEVVFYDLLDALSESSITITAEDRQTGEPFEVAVNDGVFAGLVFNAFYSTDTIADLPGAIYGTAAGDTSQLETLAAAYLSPSGGIAQATADGMAYAVTCSEEVPFEQRARIQAAQEEHPALAYPMYTALQMGPHIVDACATWDVDEPQPLRNQAVTMNNPVLLLNGEFDQITPVSYAERAAEALPNGDLFVFPGLGHGVLDAECPRSIAQDFLEAPEADPDAGCIDNMPGVSFQIESYEMTASPETPAEAGTTETSDSGGGPLDVESIALREFSSPELGVQGVAPEGWELDTEEAAFIAPDGVTSLTQQVIPAPSAGFVTPSVFNQIGVEPRDPVETLNVNGLEWARYSVETGPVVVDFAITDDGSGVYLVLMPSMAGQRDALFEAVFMPALEAFAPLN